MPNRILSRAELGLPPHYVAPPKPEWIIQFREDKPDPSDFEDWEDFDPDEAYPIELSVVQKGCHGSKSWGWGGDEKIILLDGHLGEDISQQRLDFMKKYAELMVKDLNAE